MYSLDSERETPQSVDIAFAVDIVLFTGANRFSTFRMSARTGTQSVWWGITGHVLAGLGGRGVARRRFGNRLRLRVPLLRA
jgi:hypothetical protein